MAVRVFEDLEVWKESRRLTQRIYQLTKNENFSKDFALRDQIRRAAVSVMSNIAEGFERGGNTEFARFLDIAKGSCGEVRSQMYVAKDQGYVDDNIFAETTRVASELARMLATFAARLRGKR